MPSRITVHALRAMRDRGEPHALLDVREKGEHNRRQLPHSTPVPRGLLEMRVPLLVPDRSVPVVVMSGTGNRAGLAAAKLEEMGYRDIAVLDGGLESWFAAGYPTWEGQGVPGKEYGESVAVREKIPQLTPDELAERMARGEKMVVMDSRTLEEYHRNHLPGAYSVPGGELPAVVSDLAADPGTTIVVNCAGRTRSILGSFLVSRMELPNPVFGFKNGTMAWHMSGRQLERGEGRGTVVPSAAAREASERFAARVAAEDGLKALSVDELRTMQQAGGIHYLIDVRLPEEYREGHIPGALSCPAGQLALQSEDFIAVHAAPIVTVSGGQARATFGASLLSRMGFPRVFLLEGGLEAWKAAGLPLEKRSPQVDPLGLEEARAGADYLSPAELKEALDAGEPIAVVDVRGSGDFGLGHIAGSTWIARGKLEARVAEELPGVDAPVVLVCDDGVRSTLASATLQSMGYTGVRVLRGGTGGWLAAGLPLEEGLEGAKVTLEEAKGDLPTVKRRGILDRNRDDMVRYLTWEEELGRKYEGK